MSIHAERLSKRFFGTQALDDVGFTVRAGEVHAVVGEKAPASPRSSRSWAASWSRTPARCGSGKGNVLVTGMNGVPPALRGVRDGSVAMTVEPNPANWGRLGVDVLAAYLRGEKFEQRVFIKHIVIDDATVEDAIARATRG